MATCKNCGRLYDPRTGNTPSGFCSPGCEMRFELAKKEKENFERQKELDAAMKRELDERERERIEEQANEYREYREQKREARRQKVASKECNKWCAFILCFFFGIFGAHKFYEGKKGLGVLYIFTMGLFGIGYLIDLIVLLFKPNPYNP